MHSSEEGYTEDVGLEWAVEAPYSPGVDPRVSSPCCDGTGQSSGRFLVSKLYLLIY